MALNPDEIENSQFSSSLRGYDKHEVKAYLARIARSMRQAEAEQAKQVPVVPAPLPKPALSEQSDEDRFGALGERIAALLRNAHDSAAQIKATAEAEVAEIRVQAEADVAEAQADAELARTEAAEIRAVAQTDADEIRSAAEANGLARLEERRVEIESTELAIQQDQETAMHELSNAREQVNTLLEQARAQSEFIRLEADDIIREKIRTNLEAAEDRLNVLRNTEEVSRERIRLAQDELENALGRLEADPAPALPHGDEHLIIEEAEGRAIEAGYLVGESVPVDQTELGEQSGRVDADAYVDAYVADEDAPTGVADGTVADGTVVDGTVVDGTVLDGDVIDGDAAADSEFAAAEVVTTESSDAQPSSAGLANVEPVNAELTNAGLTNAELTDVDDGGSEADHANAGDAAPEDGAESFDGDGSDQASEAPEEPTFGSVAVVEDEDALTKLVREAMQTAVETAQTGD